MATLEQQIDLEMRMVQSGIDRYYQNLTKLKGQGIESNTKHGRAIISGVVHPVAEGIQEVIDTKTNGRNIAYKKLQGMDSQKLAYLSLLTVVDSISQRYPLLKVARLCGIHAEIQKRLDEFVEREGKGALFLIEQANRKSNAGFNHKRHGLNHKINELHPDIDSWTSEERIHVGLKLIDVIIQKTGIVKLRKWVMKRGKTTTFLEATEDTLDWIKAFNEANENRLPRYSPCIIPPKDWTGIFEGGYHSSHINQLPIIRVHR